MKTGIALVLGAFALIVTSFAEGEDDNPKAAFEKLKTLVGTWVGEVDMGEEKPTEMKLVYRLVAGGSVLEERSFPGTPKEMVTMYHQQGDQLVMTHYCMLGNQPRLTLAKTDGGQLHFDFDPSCGIDVAKEMHMHSMVMTLVDGDTVRQEWTMFADGEAMGKNPVTLKRVKG